MRTSRRQGVAVPRWAVLLVLVGLVTSVFLVVLRHSPSEADQVKVDPLSWSAPLWQDTLGGDTATTAADLSKLSDLTQSNLPRPDAQALVALATSVQTAETTGAGRSAYPQYFPVAASSQTVCTNLAIQAVSPMQLPLAGVKRAKVLVAWTATCPSNTVGYVPGTLQVGYVYAIQSKKDWLPQHDWELPHPATATALPAAWQVKNFSTCGSAANAQYTDLIIVVDAFEKMCAAAAADNVALVLTAGLRTPTAQHALFQEAVKHYGSRTEALKWVAFSDGTTCSSKHCTGAALDVKDTPNALAWLEATAGCDVSGTVTLAAACTQGTVVQRMQRYGFVSPASNIPTYLEFYLPTDPTALGKPSDCTPTGTTTPQTIASVWRCRLQSVEITGSDQDRIVAEALVVSRCESGWNPTAVAYGGRYRFAADPVTGLTYNNSGLFMLTPTQANQFVLGGAGALSDPVANASGAASLWLATRTWDAFGCATGHGAAFESGPVLPLYGGPALPAWSAQY